MVARRSFRTLTTGSLNSSLSNAPWHAPYEPKDKRRRLIQHSLLKLNSTVVADHPESFTEVDVDERGAYLAALINDIWPGPETAETIVVTPPPTEPPGKHSDPPRRPDADAPTPPTREAIRALLRSGLDTSETSDRLGGGRDLWLTVLEEEARVAGEILTRPPEPADAVALRDERSMRWERIAARLYGRLPASYRHKATLRSGQR